MKFPITRESLQAFDYAKEQEEVKEEEVQKQLTLILERLCKEFQQAMPSNSKEKRFVWNGLRNITRFNANLIEPMNTPLEAKSPLAYNSSKKDYVPIFIDKLKEVFIGCDIIIDPLRTYLIIDWS